MPLVCLGITLGTPSQVGEVPITVSNLAATIAQAVTDTTALQAQIGTVQTDATAADTDAAQVQTDLTNATTDANTASANAATADTQVGACGTDFDAVASTGATFNILTLFPGTTYSTVTKQIGGTPSASQTLTVAQQQGLIALLNTLGAALVTAKTDTALVKTNATQVVSDLNTATADAATTKLATAATKTAATATSTAAVATDHTNAQAIIASANVFLQTDSGVVANVAALNGALVAALTFVRDTNILPT